MKKQVDLFIVPFINLHIYIGMSVCLSVCVSRIVLFSMTEHGRQWWWF